MSKISTKHVVLGLLGLGERHGYEIRRELESLDAAWRLEFGQLYRILAGLERDGLVKGRSAPSLEGPSRKLYNITTKGLDALERWLLGPLSPAPEARDELAIRLKVGRALGTEGLDEMLEARGRNLEAQISHIEEERTRVDSAENPDAWLVLETRRRHLEGSLDALGVYQRQLQRTDGRRSSEEAGDLEAAGSDDPVLGLLGSYLARRDPPVHFSSRPLGSLGGLLALREGRAHVAGTHLLDVETGEYNVPFIKRQLFENPVVLVNLAFREQGLMVAAGNEKGIQGIADLARQDVRLINRQHGAGTRLLLHVHLKRADLKPEMVRGFEVEAPTHDAVAAAVAEGRAEVGMGIRAVATAWGLDFIPLGRERFDLATTRALYDSRRLAPLRDVLTDRDFRREVSERPGYGVERMGEIVAEIG